MERVALVGAVIATAMALTLRSLRGRRPTGTTDRASGAVDDGWRVERVEDTVRVRLDVELDVVEGASPPEALERLARTVALDALAEADASVRAVLVVDRLGRTVLRVGRSDPLPPVRDTERAAPAEHVHAPSPVPDRGPGRPRPAATSAGGRPGVTDPPTGRHALADRLTLPSSVRTVLRSPESPADVVRALLEASGRSVEARGDLVVADAFAIAIADVRDDAERALARAHLRLAGSGAPRGLIVVLGFADPAHVRRRELANPRVRHVDLDALQRMADAVAVGLDPIAFAAPPRPRA